MCYVFAPPIILHLASPHHQYSNMNKGDLTKHCLLLRLLIKLMHEKVKVCDRIQCKRMFLKSCRKFKIYFLLSKSVFCDYTSIFTHFHYNFKMEWWFIKLRNYNMSNKAEPFNLIQIFRLLQLAPVTFRPTLPYYEIINP